MAKINTEGKDQIAGGVIYHADEDGFVDIPDKIAEAEGLAVVAVEEKGQSVKDIRAALGVLGVSIPRETTKKDDLLALYKAKRAEAEALAVELELGTPEEIAVLEDAALAAKIAEAQR